MALQKIQHPEREIFNNILDSENAVKLLQEHGEDIVASEIFGSLPFNVARRILESDNLGVAEEEIFNVAMKWNVGAEIKGIIRFTRMELQFLYDTVKPSGILSDGDLVQIYEYKLGFIQELNGFNCDERVEVKRRRTRGRARAQTKKKTKPQTPTKSKKKATPKKKGSTKKKTGSKKKSASKKRATRSKKK